MAHAVTGRKPRVSADQRSDGPPIKRAKKLRIKTTAVPKGSKPPAASPNKLAFSMREFCELHGISLDHLHRLMRRHEGPVMMKSGARTMISFEAAAAWRRKCEQAAAGSAAAENAESAARQ